MSPVQTATSTAASRHGPGHRSGARPRGYEELFCRVLGPFEWEINGAPVHLGGPAPRRLLAALSTADSSPVADAALANAVWSANPPADIAQGLRVIVSRLRSVLGPHARGCLRRDQLGYSLHLPRESTDHSQFRASVDRGRRLLAQGRPDLALTAFDSALTMWRGEPWPELADSLLAAGARAGLVELREVAIEEAQAARLELGDHTTAVVALKEAVIHAPYRERRWELLALGLYRGARQAHALAELRRVRKILTDELGIQPGLALRNLEQQILAQDPTLHIIQTSGSREK